MDASTALLRELVDYAGLFPPAGLDMATAVKKYAAYRRSPHAWMLGRFVVPASRLHEFKAAWAALAEGPSATRPWRLSVLVGPDVQVDARVATAFAGCMSTPTSSVVIDAWEVTAETAEDVHRVAAAVPPGVSVAYELPLSLTARGARPALLDAIRQVGGIAKARTGGVTITAIPAVADVAAFIWDCARTQTPFKATAGLHHRVRGTYRLTYAPDSPSAVMHGFVNVFVTASIARREAARAAAGALDVPPATIAAALDERDPTGFIVAADAVRWRNVSLSNADISDTRSHFALSFGSCSFEEPVAELVEAGILR